MRVAVVSDIHSNLAAFEAVTADFVDVDEVWCLGDVVGYGPDPNECIDHLRSFDHCCIAGNHDWAAIGRIGTEDFNPDAQAAAEWTAQQLAPANWRFLEDLPTKLERNGFTLAHGSPRDPIWEYIIYSSAAEASLDHFTTAYCFVGHTHVPVIFSCAATARTCATLDPSYERPFPLGNQRLIINPGSVGQPRDGVADARYVVLDLDRRTFTHRRVAYDIAKTQRKMQQASLPARLWMRLSYGW
ncbi:MAG: metallophosphatase family protein [Chloroflexi bacterium]|nr:metallophosphatase family protein [Chloroflexota bacterium]